MDRKPIPAPYPVGTKLRYLAKQYELVGTLTRGMVGTVTEVRPGYQGTLQVLAEDDDGEPILDTTRDGYNVVTMENGFTRAISPDSDTWEPA